MAWGTVSSLQPSTIGWDSFSQAHPYNEDKFFISGQAGDYDRTLAMRNKDGSFDWVTEYDAENLNGSGQSISYNPEEGVIGVATGVNGGGYFKAFDPQGNEVISGANFPSEIKGGEMISMGSDGWLFMNKDTIYRISSDGSLLFSINPPSGAAKAVRDPSTDQWYIGTVEGDILWYNSSFGLEQQASLEAEYPEILPCIVNDNLVALVNEDPNAATDNRFYDIEKDLSAAQGYGSATDIGGAAGIKGKLYEFGNYDNNYSIYEVDPTNGSRLSDIATGRATDIGVLEGGDEYLLSTCYRDSINYFTTGVNVGYRIYGAVYDVEESGVQGLTVGTQSGSSSTTTSSSGEFEFFEKDGTYAVQVSGSGYFDTEKSVTVNGGSESLGFVVQRSDISGQVFDVGGDPVDSVNVNLKYNGEVVSSIQPTNGSYRFDGDVSKNTDYTVSIEDPSGEYFEDSLDVEVRDREVSGVDFLLDTFSEFEFTLTDRETGGSVAGTSVNVLEEERKQANSNTDSNGVAKVKTGTRFDGPVNVIVGGGDNRYATRRIPIDPDNGDISISLTMVRKTNIGNAV